MIESIGVEEIREQAAAVVRGRCAPEDIGQFVGAAYGDVMTALGEQGLAPAGPPLCRYLMGAEGMDEQGQAAMFTLAAGFPTDGPVAASGRVEAMTLPAGSAVVALHVGAWTDLGQAYSAVAQWMADHDLEPAGDPWEAYLDGPEVEEHRTMLTSPCRPRS